MRTRIALCTLAMGVLPLLVGAAETHTVTIEGMKFQPDKVTVNRGDTVTWRNKDVVPHTATAAGKFDSQQIGVGASWSWTATSPGEIDYVCTNHPGMKATVVVK